MRRDAPYFQVNDPFGEALLGAGNSGGHQVASITVGKIACHETDDRCLARRSDQRFGQNEGTVGRDLLLKEGQAKLVSDAEKAHSGKGAI